MEVGTNPFVSSNRKFWASKPHTYLSITRLYMDNITFGGGGKTPVGFPPPCAIVLQRKLVKAKGVEFRSHRSRLAGSGGALLYAGTPNSAQTSPDKSVASLSGFPGSLLFTLSFISEKATQRFSDFEIGLQFS